ncbi:hypothetical protein [Bdellovibrio sp. HCB2-146]|uniref:hypothetical protein n=1 Tax=Bdellovibrio sp. HCB2-146 TaxID=3394362 RepID=UPI0039BC7AB4
MRHLHVTAKYLIIFLLVCFVTVLGGVVYLSYHTVQKLTQVATDQSESEPNLSAVLKLTGSYLEDIRQYEEFLTTLGSDKWPSFCSVICNPSHFNRERYVNERTPYLVSYYRQQKKQAAADPVFRMKIAQLDFLRETVPSSLRNVMRDILVPQSQHSIASLSFRLDGAMMTVLPFAQSRYNQAKARLEILNQVREIASSCGKAPKKEVIERCEVLVPGQ